MLRHVQLLLIKLIYTPDISSINTYFSNPRHSSIFNENGGVAGFRTCDSDLCTKHQYTGKCISQDSLDPKFGVVCSESCPPKHYFYPIGVNAGCYQIQEWGCSADPYSNAGVFKVSKDCTISGSDHVTVTNELNITGAKKDMNDLVTVTAATNHRHFYVNGGTLSLRYLKLTGGDVYPKTSISDQSHSFQCPETKIGTRFMYAELFYKSLPQRE